MEIEERSSVTSVFFFFRASTFAKQFFKSLERIGKQLQARGAKLKTIRVKKRSDLLVDVQYCLLGING
jgi:hypothetical protein